MGSKAELGKPILLGELGSAAIIWLHGFGDTPLGWASALQTFRTSIDEKWRWVHLCAPTLPQPCFGNKKLPAWGQFKALDCIHVGSVDYENEDGYAASVAAVMSQLEELEKTLPANRILLGGFSQGAAVALECALCYPRALAGCVVLSGWATPTARRRLSSPSPAPSASAASSPPATSFLLCHGEADDMVGLDCAEAAAESLQKAGAQVQLHKYPGLEHGSCPQLLKTVADFMCKRLGCPLPEDITWEESDSESDGEDLIYVPRRLLDGLCNQLANNASIGSSSIADLLSPSGLGDSEILVPAVIAKPERLLAVAPADAIRELQQAREAAQNQLGNGIPGLRASMTVKEFREMQVQGDSCEQAEEEDMSDDEEAEDSESPEPGESSEPPAKRPRDS
ncbi:unnamed protein product [Effrenium voratum]|uniref:Phospholipase/carboxylesterase/thioesterase domain-containing protein n=1 Tax=Effrenium voratum TaxID=2562239 RepID=A0AA36NJ11_9DINO|nr:unnamed protein product [Effrenium voratum]CAJ1422682.1 unnamed protein product [Effrenium voratum]